MDQWLLELQLVRSKYSHVKWLDREVIFSWVTPRAGGRGDAQKEVT